MNAFRECRAILLRHGILRNPTRSQHAAWKTVHSPLTKHAIRVSGYNGHEKQFSSSSPSSPSPRTALFFPGQGVQRVGMADPWLAAFPSTCKPFLAEMDDILQTPLSKTISEGPNSVLTATGDAQPAIMATSIMILRVLEQDFDFKTPSVVDVTLGHSLGEFAALVAGGYIEYPAALRMIRRRADAMARCSREASQANNGAEYGMVALVCEPDRLESLISTIDKFLGYASNPGQRPTSQYQDEDIVPPIDQVLIANMNSKNQIVLSGNIERIQALLVQLRQFGGHDPRAVRLKSDSPFHSPIMLPARQTMTDILSQTKITYPGLFPCISNVSARPFSSEADLKDLLARQCVETVRWWDSIRYLDQEMGIRRWIGIGPGKVGRNLVGKEVGMRGSDVVRGGGVWGISNPKEVEIALRGLEETEGVCS
ncbi:hypothetical protein MMC09_005344 [Bachmanniomyces sp. S44760]|nr:hypothetical protein [Bachmanniomyces sp. S44760]